MIPGEVQAGGHTSGSLAALVGAELTGPADAPVKGVQTAERAGATDLVFVRSLRYAPAWSSTAARTALVTRGVELPEKAGAAVLTVKDADEALSAVLAALAPPAGPRPPGRHATAVVSEAASVAGSVHIGPHCVVEEGAVLEDGVVLVARVFIGRGARVGAGTVLHPGVCIYERCRLGRGCLVHAGVVVGADGFGFRPAPGGRGLVKVPHIGDVVVGDDVEIGANSCIDRAKFGSTTIGSNSKLDNMVQVGHNVTVGRSVVLCGQVGLAGSCTIGDGAVLAGQVGVADHLTVGPMARVGAASGVLDDIPARQSWLGYPAMPSREQLRYWSWLKGFSQRTRTQASDTRQAEADAREAAIPGTARWTIASPATLSGVGLFCGEAATVHIHPAAGGGLQFRTPAGTFPLSVALLAPEDRAGPRARNTSLVVGGVPILTVEHLLSALAGLGITDALIEVAGREVPMFDGSARPFAEALVSAGLTPLESRVDPIVLRAPVTVSAGEARITAAPRAAAGCSVSYELDYGAGLPAATAAWDGTGQAYRRGVAWARTFCLASEARAMRERGLFAHVTPREMLVLDDRTGEPIDNALKSADEPARHKLLDVIGDLALLGRPLRADVTAVRSGHALTHELCRAILAHAAE